MTTILKSKEIIFFIKFVSIMQQEAGVQSKVSFLQQFFLLENSRLLDCGNPIFSFDKISFVKTFEQIELLDFS